MTTEGSAHASSSSDNDSRRPTRWRCSASATARPTTSSSTTDTTANVSVTRAAFQKRGSVARKAKWSSPTKRAMPKIGTRCWSDSHSTHSPG